MARKYSSGEVKAWLGKHRELYSNFRKLDELAQRSRGEIQSAASKITAESCAQLLENIQVDELSRHKKGIRVKSLHDAGFHTIADILRANPMQISAINGISPDGAKEIKKIAVSIAKTAQDGEKIRLSADDKNRSSTALKPATGGLRWAFSSSSKKQAADAACAELSQILSDANLAPVNESLNVLRQQFACVSEKDAWDDFSRDSISYINILETIEPDKVGSGDDIYGLPEELAESVAAVELDLSGLSCTLRRYQEWGVKYAVAQRRILLGDEMGLGKTVQAIAAMVHLRNGGATHFAVVCPASVLTNWCREIEKHSDLGVVRVHGSGKNAAMQSWLSEGGVAVTTYETTSVFELGDSFRITMLTVDEAHYIKNPSAQRTVNVKRLCTHADRLLFMTGTALENKVEEMAVLINILNSEVAKDIRPLLSLSSAPQFRDAVAPVYYRRKREDVLTELPELIESCEWCDLLPEEKRIYRDAISEQNFMAARRVSWQVDDLEKSSKAKRLLEIIEDAREQERKVLIFSFFLDTVAKIAALLGDSCMEPITGSVSPARRQEIIDEFDKAPAGTSLIAQIQSGGTGLNIQCASVVILCEPQLKPSIENQAISRAYRMGQTRSVLVYKLLCEDSIDERMVEILRNKQQSFDAFADESAAARESIELDTASFNKIINDEIERINAANGQQQV